MTVYDASSNTVYKLDSASTASRRPRTDAGHAAVGRRDRRLPHEARPSTRTSPAAQPTDVAGQPAYSVKISPEARRRAARIARSSPGTPPTAFRCASAIYAQGSSTPVLQLAATDISYGAVSSSDVDGRAAGRSEDRRPRRASRATRRRGTSRSPASPRSRPQPASPSSRPTRSSVCRGRTYALVGGADSKRLVVYGQGLGAIVVVERKARRRRARSEGCSSSLPTVSLDGAHRPRARDAARHGASSGTRNGVVVRPRRLAAARRGRGGRARR